MPATLPNSTRARPVSDNALALGEAHLRSFLVEQREDFGATMEIAPGRWALIAVQRGDHDNDFLARAVLESATFPLTEGSSDDDNWTIFHVDTPTQTIARHWLDTAIAWLTGEAISPSPQDVARLNELLTASMPHRIGRSLVEDAERGALPPAVLRDPTLVQALIDRMHRQEPTFLAAILLMVEHHLIDLLVLYRTLTNEDLNILNDLTQGNVSQDPFLLNRQSAAASLRQQLIAAKILNPLDQRKHVEASNPYSQITRLRRQSDGTALLRIDGIDQRADPAEMRESITKIRQRDNRGIDSLAPESRAPWATEERAYHLRFIRQLAAENPRLRTADLLYMVERALEV